MATICPNPAHTLATDARVRQPLRSGTRRPAPTLFAFAFLAACGGGGGGGDDIPNLPPSLSNLRLSADTFDWAPDGTRSTVTATVDYNDREADIERIHILLEGEPEVSFPIEGPLGGSTGTLLGDFEFSTTESGVYAVQVWAVDRAGNSSNRLTVTITVIGSTSLTNLSISAAALAPSFAPQFPGEYTAIVGTMTTFTTVTATTEDPNAQIAINGTPALSGVATGDFPLALGDNPISVTVSTAGGAAVETYTIRILRNAVDVIQRAYLKASNASFGDYFGESLAISGDTLVVSGPLDDSGATGVNGDQSDAIFAPDSGAAYVFVRDPAGIWTQQAYLKASNTGIADYFGSAVAIEGDTIAIGASSESSAATGIDGDQSDNSVSGAGAVYVFIRDIDSNWSQQAYVKSSTPPQLSPLFGEAVALSADTLVVGAPGESLVPADFDTEFSGSVYIYMRDAGGVWSEQGRLIASDPGGYDQFGSSLALEGDTLVIGAPERFFCTGCDTSIESGGRVYVHTRDASGIWTEQARLQPANLDMFHRFGATLALEGDTLTVGAPEGGADGGGAVYVYTRDADGVWSEQAPITALDTSIYDRFGSVLSLEGGVLLIGASGHDNHGASSGAAYLFAQNAELLWEQQTLFMADFRDDDDYFGSAVASNGQMLIVGAKFEDSGAMGIDGDQSDNSAPEAGAVYVFE